MIVRVKLDALRQSNWRELILRFLLGGAATVLAGVVARVWGPSVGGLFLAFPVVFCASATLVERHEKRRKEQKGLKGARRGRNAAALDANGAVFASIGMAAFGGCIWLLAARPALAMCVATAAWAVVSCLLWWTIRR
jgi:hypothetical protein